MKVEDEPFIKLWKYHKSSKWYRTLVSKAICFFTGSIYTHVAICYDHFQYESTVMNNQNGTMKSACGYDPDNHTLLKFKIPLNDRQRGALERVLNREVIKARPYNFFKLFVLAIVYPTRKFWNCIGWVPFQAEFFGNVCSVFVDSVFKSIGIDLLPGNNEEYTAPGDFLKSKLLEEV